MMSPQMHQEHMQKMMAALQAILASEDIAEIKKIAQEALGEEQMEAESEGEKEDGAFRDALGKAVAEKPVEEMK